MVTEEILSPTKFVTKWTSIGYCKTSYFFFWLIFPVHFPPSLITIRFPLSSLMNTSLGESLKFPMSSISIPSSFFSNIAFFSKGLPFQWNPDFFENKIRKIKQVNICKRSILDYILYIFIYLALTSKLQQKQIK